MDGFAIARVHGEGFGKRGRSQNAWWKDTKAAEYAGEARKSRLKVDHAQYSFGVIDDGTARGRDNSGKNS